MPPIDEKILPIDHAMLPIGKKAFPIDHRMLAIDEKIFPIGHGMLPIDAKMFQTIITQRVSYEKTKYPLKFQKNSGKYSLTLSFITLINE